MNDSQSESLHSLRTTTSTLCDLVSLSRWPCFLGDPKPRAFILSTLSIRFLCFVMVFVRVIKLQCVMSVWSYVFLRVLIVLAHYCAVNDVDIFLVLRRVIWERFVCELCCTCKCCVFHCGGSDGSYRNYVDSIGVTAAGYVTSVSILKGIPLSDPTNHNSTATSMLMQSAKFVPTIHKSKHGPKSFVYAVYSPVWYLFRSLCPRG